LRPEGFAGLHHSLSVRLRHFDTPK
jgi:hypothetical protein